MKKTFFFSLFSLFALATVAQELIVKGRINASETTTIVLTDGIKSDTLVTTSGNFYFKRACRGLLLSISILDHRNGITARKEFFAQSGQVLIDQYLNLSFSDSSLQLKYEEFKKKYDLLVELKTDMVRYHLNSKRTPDEKSFFDSAYNDLLSVMVRMVENIIEENKDNLVGPYICAGYFLDGVDTGRVLKAYSLLNKNLFDTSYALQIIKKRVDVLEGLSPGKLAPVFAAISDKGQHISSEGLKGKYAVLDYWGVWCGPCLLGMPRMKEYYEKYKEKVEFVGISCRENEKTWIESLKRFALPWPQVLNLQSREGLETIYSVVRFPTKVIVDPEGKLVAIFIGETDEFYSALDQLFKGVITASTR